MEVGISGKKAAILGGDRRKLEMARRLRKAGAEVLCFGTTPEITDVVGRPLASSVAEAVEGAEIVICPTPGVANNGDLYAPFSDIPVRLDAKEWDLISSGAILFTGGAPEWMKKAGEERGIHVSEYGHDDEGAIYNGIPTAEGALRCAIDNSDGTIHSSNIMIVGFGRVAETTVHVFLAMGGKVFLVARRAGPRTRAFEMGCIPLPMEELDVRWEEMSIIISTVPLDLFSRERISRSRSDQVLIDLVSPPGSTDFDAAEELGVIVHWERGQAGTAARFTGRNQWLLAERYLDEHFSK